MSFSLDVVSLTGATAGTTGTVSWANLAQSVGYGIPEAGPPHVALLNESPCGLQLQFSTGEQMSLPAGGWQTITLNPTCTNFSYKVLYVLNASPIVASLLGTWYAPGEPVPDAPILGNSPIGATVPVSPIANELQGVGQSKAVTEKDVGGLPALAPVSTVATPLLLLPTDTNGNPDSTAGITIDPAGIGNSIRGNTAISGAINQLSSVVTAGLGVPAIAAMIENKAVATTTLTTILTYAVPADGANHTLRVNAWCDVNNSVSGNNIALQVLYSDPRSGLTTTTPFSTATSTASQSFNAAASIINGIYAMYPYTIYCKPNSTVTIQYRDPTNTPNDHVSAFIECIS